MPCIPPSTPPSAHCVISSITRSPPVELSRPRQGFSEASCSKSSLAQTYPKQRRIASAQLCIGLTIGHNRSAKKEKPLHGLAISGGEQGSMCSVGWMEDGRGKLTKLFFASLLNELVSNGAGQMKLVPSSRGQVVNRLRKPASISCT